MKQKLNIKHHNLNEEDSSIFTLLFSPALTDLLLMNASSNGRTPSEELIYRILATFDGAVDESVTCLAANIP